MELANKAMAVAGVPSLDNRRYVIPDHRSTIEPPIAGASLQILNRMLSTTDGHR